MISYNELLNSNINLSYQDLLLTKEWFDKRAEILIKDNNCCVKCRRKPTIKGFDERAWKKFYFRIEADEWVKAGKTELGVVMNPVNAKILVFDKPCVLNIHHKYYISNRLPWDYTNDAFQTLCSDCHKKEHEENAIVVYDEELNILYTPKLCSRCDGKGYLPMYDYYQNGVCFQCWGEGVMLTQSNIF